mgnify:CR=1 FL=1
MLKRGTQVAFIPSFVTGSLKEKLAHRQTELGFVETINNNGVWCRFWSHYSPNELRTKANAEMTPPACIVEYNSHDQTEVDGLLKELER